MRRGVACVPALLVAAALVCSACSPTPTGKDTPKETCQKANDIQRKATAAEAAIASGSSGAETAIAELGGAVTGAIRGAKAGTPPATDLQVVLNDVDRLKDDFTTDKSAVPADVGTLKDSLTKLAMDCSVFLTG